MKLLSTVEDIVTIPGRGTFLFPGLPMFDPEMPPTRVNDKIQLRTPDGHIRDTYIAGIAHAKTIEGSKYPIQLPPEITQADVPTGTEVWLL